MSSSSLDREASPLPTWVRWRIVALLVAFSFMSWFNRFSMPIAYDEQIQNESGITEEAIGSVYSAFFLAYTLCMVPGGWLVDRFGTRFALVVMGFGSALFGALTGLAGLPALGTAGSMLAVFLVIRSLMGVFSAPIYPAASRAVYVWIPYGRRTLANGLVQAGAALGMAFAFPVFGTLIDLVGWPMAFVYGGILTALVALVWSIYATDHPAQHSAVNKVELRYIDAGPPRADTGQSARSQFSANWLNLLQNRSLLLLTISYGCLGYLEYLFFHWMRHYLNHVLHADKADSRLYGMILYLGFAVGMVLGGWVTDRLERQRGHGKGRTVVPILGMTAGALFLWLGLLVGNIHGIVACLTVAIAFVGAVEASVWTTAVELGGSQGGTAAGICNTGGNLFGLVAPVLTPFLSHQVMTLFGATEQVGWQWGIALGGLICLFGAVLWLWIDAHER